MYDESNYKVKKIALEINVANVNCPKALSILPASASIAFGKDNQVLRCIQLLVGTILVVDSRITGG